MAKILQIKGDKGSCVFSSSNMAFMICDVSRRSCSIFHCYIMFFIQQLCSFYLKHPVALWYLMLLWSLLMCCLLGLPCWGIKI